MKSRITLLALAALACSLWVPPTHATAAEGEPELIQLYQYKPLYFLMGNPYTKVELSIKAQVIRSLPVYVAYTQLMMWDLFVPSPYFYDINYDPEIFYRLPIAGSSERWLDLSPFEHESNGRGGSDERSWNRSYVRYHTRTPLPGLSEKAKLIWDLKAWIGWYVHVNNPDIANYRGTWEVTVTLADFLGPFFELDDLALRIYPGGASTTNPLLGGQELTFRAKSRWREFLPLFVGQVFHGYGENLLDLAQNRWGLRVGIGF